MKKWIGILLALSLVLAFSLPAYAQQKAKPAPMSKEEANKMMEECMKEMETSMAKMKERHEKMHKGEMQVDAAKMKKMNPLPGLKPGVSGLWHAWHDLRPCQTCRKRPPLRFERIAFIPRFQSPGFSG